jgi:heat shock protein HtpX
MFINKLKTVLLLGILSGLCLLMGELLGGKEGLITALIIALLINGIAYFFSDRLVLHLYKAKPLDRTQHPDVYNIIEELRTSMELPMPKLWFINTHVANAFATGRSPHHASIAVTKGILELLDHEELRGVLAHELSHVKNRDILVGTLAAIIATTIGHCANMLRHVTLWSSHSHSDSKRKGLNPFITALISLIIPIIATLIQLAISRYREYLADETGAEACHNPLALASALEKIENSTRFNHFSSEDTARAATAHLFIVNPFLGGSLMYLLSTHPPIPQRIERLKKIFEKQYLS